MATNGDIVNEYFKPTENGITKADFTRILTEIYNTKDDRYSEIFDIFDRDQDGILNQSELKYCTKNWFSSVIHPVSALLIVDVQNDFICGTLDIRNCPAKHNGEDIITPINCLLKTVEFDKIFYTLDWHPENHISFYENKDLRKFDVTSPVPQSEAKLFDMVTFSGDPPFKQVLWPRHCVQGSWGSQLHKDLLIVDDAIQIKKGTNPEIDSYSAFWDNEKKSMTDLIKHLKEAGVTDVYVCGLAYDVCVGSTAIDALTSGFRTILIEDCCRGVDEDDIKKVKDEILSNHGIIVQSKDVESLLKGSIKRVELGYFLAKYLQKHMKLTC